MERIYAFEPALERDYLRGELHKGLLIGYHIRENLSSVPIVECNCCLAFLERIEKVGNVCVENLLLLLKGFRRRVSE